ncbi:MAG: UDP-N-acetylmuramate--L-alanine ligase, partial [Spirochaetaceae bacterium]|nr:UDP-N-acetylmuramate--L-alanine ligase [Spirochaetaceae bacterium]
FGAADEVILHKIYPSAREKYDGTVTGRILYERTKQNHQKVSYYEEILDALPYVSSIVKPGDLFITMGAGDNWKIGKALIEQLTKRK